MDELSYIASSPNCTFRYMTVSNKLKEQAEMNPNKDIFIFYSLDGKRESITFSELYKKSLKFSRSLKSLGIRKGDKVIMYLYNCMDWLIICFGLMAIGAIPVGSYIVQKDASDLKHVVEKTGAVAIFFASLSLELSNGIKRLVERTSSKLKFAVSLDIDDDDGPLLSYRKLREMELKEVLMCDVCLDPDDIAIIIRSSGTTGRPKFIPHSHVSLEKIFGMRSTVKGKMYADTEFSWIGGTPVISVFSGVSRVTVSARKSQVSAKKHLGVIDAEYCEAIFLAPAVLNRILRDKLSFPPCVKVLFVGGSPLKRKMKVFFDHVNCMFSTYGTLEIGPVAVVKMESAADIEDNIGGYILPGLEVKITDETNKIVMRETRGKLFIRRDYPFRGYCGDEVMTKQVVTSSGWYETGDVGYISKDNKLFILGRNNEWVARGERTHHVAEIERLIMGLNIQEICDVVIVSVPDDIHGEEICACVTLNEGHTSSPDILLKVFNDLIQNDEWTPKYVVLVDSFPVNTNGKLMRNTLTEHAIKTLQGRAGGS